MQLLIKTKRNVLIEIKKGLLCPLFLIDLQSIDFCFKIYFLIISKEIKYLYYFDKKIYFENLISLIPFISITILILGCSNKPVEKEMKLPMLLSTT